MPPCAAETRKLALIANYTSGNVAVFPILPDGKLEEHTAVRTDAGTRLNKERQEEPHAHWIELPLAGNRYAYVADLGLDRVLIYKFDATKGTLTPADAPSSSATAAAASAKTNEAFSATLSPWRGATSSRFPATAISCTYSVK